MIFLLLIASPLAFAEARLALVIGNAAYRSETLGPLNNPVNDAKAIAQMLQRLGFEVTLHTDVTKKAFGKALRTFEEQLASQPGQVGLLFYSGHGLRGTDANNYLLPVDANPQYQEDIQWEGIPVERVLKEMEAAKPRMSLLIIDACRNTLLRSKNRGVVEQGMQIIQAPKGSLIAFATAPNEQAKDYVALGDRHSPYVAALLEHLPKPGLTIEQVFKETRRTVLAKTQEQQTPWENSSLIGRENFYFVASSASTRQVEPPVSSSTPTVAPPSEADLQNKEIKTWSELKRADGKVVGFEGSAWFCQAKTPTGDTECFFGAKPPKPGCYVMLNRELTAWIAVQDAAEQLRTDYLSAGQGKPVSRASGFGCGVPDSGAYWLLWQIN